MVNASRLAVVIGITQVLAWATSFYVPAIGIPIIAARLDVSPTLLFGGFSWALLLTGLCSPATGRWIDRAGGRHVLALGSMFMGAGLLVMAATPETGMWRVPHWYFAWTIEGVGMALGLYDAAFATIGRLLGAAARPAIVGTTMISGFASTVGWSAGATIIDAYGWRELLLAYAAVQLVVIVPAVLLLVPRAEPHPRTADGPAAGSQPLPDGRSFALLACFLVLRSAISAVVFVHLLTLLRGLGLGPTAAVATASIIGPCQVGARLIDWMFGRGLDPLNGARIGAALLPLGAVGMLAGLPAWCFAAAYGLSNGILTISRGVLPLYLFGPRGYATLLGRLALPQLLMQAMMPTLAAPLGPALPAAWIVGAFAALSAIALLCIVLLRGPTRAYP